MSVQAESTKSPEAAWGLRPGDTISRVVLHDRFGGSRQSGISPSARSPNILIFTDPASGEQHGYFDQWIDGVFHYTGEGQHGPQQLIRGNGAVAAYVERGQALRLFEGARGIVRYSGHFILDPAKPFYWDESSETGGGPVRQVIKFRLVPVGAEPPGAPLAMPETVGSPYQRADENIQTVPPDPFPVDPNAIDRGRRGHAVTQNALADFVECR